MEPLNRTNRELVKKCHVFDLYQDTIELPDGTKQMYDFVKHKGAAAVIPVTESGKILMVKQYRNALDRFTLEIPAGGRDGEEEPTIVCAARELEEETGHRSNHLELLLSLKTTVAFCNELIDVYVARNLEKTAQHLDEGEFVDVYEYDIQELVQMIYDCKIQDSKTVSALLAYYVKYVLGKEA